MDTERINALMCTIGEGSLTAAAEKLGYTTSGVSRMMAALEEETETELAPEEETETELAPGEETETELAA